MSRDTRTAKCETNLHALESEFRDTLVAALDACAQAGANVFLTVEEAERRGDIYPRLVTADQRRLSLLASEIQSLRSQLGIKREHDLIERFREYCSMSASNDLGPARRARRFLDEELTAES